MPRGGVSVAHRLADVMQPLADHLWRHRLLWHLVLPTACSAVLLVAYFAGPAPVRSIIAPAVNREYGVLEHLQLVPLMVLACVALVGRHRSGGVVRPAWTAVVVVAVVLLLEELDYGLHHAEWLLDTARLAPFGIRNLHNTGETTDVLKRVCDLAIGIGCVLLPLCRNTDVLARVRRAVPSRWYVATTVVAALTGVAAHAWSASGPGPGPLAGNLAEFRELLTYYIGMLLGLDALARPVAITTAAPNRPSAASTAGMPSWRGPEMRQQCPPGA